MRITQGRNESPTKMTLTDTALAARVSHSRTRNGTVDLVRLLAAIFIVLFHARAPGGMFMTPAVAAFAAILAFNACNSARAPGGLTRRADRYLRPFLAWLAVFVVVRTVDAVLSGVSVVDTLLTWFPPNGTMHHLWFLPFGFAVASLAPWCLHYLRALAGDAGSILILSLAACAWLVFWLGLELPPGVRIFGLYLPSVALGMALALVPQRPAPLLFAFLGCLLVGLCLRDLNVNNSAQIFFGLPVVIAALALPLPDSPVSRLAADLSLAIYLVHPIVMAVILRLTPLEFGSLSLGLAVLACSAAVGFVLLRIPLRRFFL